jgi:glycosyltransferase involved in cell wall biosynthesis
MTLTETPRSSAEKSGRQHPPRVLLFTDSDVFAGTERHILELAEGLRAGAVPVKIACPLPSVLAERATASGLPLVTIQKGGLLDFAAIRILKGLLRSGEIDLIHAHNGRTGLSAAIATAQAGLGASVATQHFIEPGRVRQSFLKRILSGLAHGWTNARITRFVAISAAVREAMLARHDAPAEKIVSVPNGISAPDIADSSSIRAEFNIPAEAPLIVCVARLEREKDQSTLIAAMQQVVRTQPSVRCLLVGEGAEKAVLEAQIAAARLAGSVTLTGFRSDSLAIIQAADVFVLPSPAEPFGLVILEAMALAKPVIAMSAGGPREIVVDNETGRLVPPAQPEALAAAIRQLLADPELRTRMGENGRTRFAEKYTTQQMARATLAAYEEALQARAAR